jgi:hypothetical protein
MGSSTLKVVGVAALAYATGGVGGLTAGQTAMAAAATTAYSEGEKARSEQEHQMQMAAEEQRQARSVSEAEKAQQAAIEQRQQIREERVRRARIIQSATNSGTLVSSGVSGATGSLSTQLGANLGANMGSLMRGGEISAFNQKAADYGLAGQMAGFDAQNMGTLFSLSTSIFASSLAPKANKNTTDTTS